ncbi:MAG TPA: MYXO-CTERM sorting domain-containing protein [Polyangiaceae bacterium]|nr:MYXO-CTERM sorting domain-containing protein [Polyangiaceae bacterium]
MALRFSATRLLLLAVAVFPRPALAVPQFPGVIARELGLDYEPPCSVCHLTNKTGAPTVTTPFGYALKARGFTEGDDTLSSALSRLAADHTDSDGDGVDDVTELKNRTDPNSKTNASLTGVADPSFGCSTTHGRGSAPGWGLAAVAVALGLIRRSKRAPTA